MELGVPNRHSWLQGVLIGTNTKNSSKNSSNVSAKSQVQNAWPAFTGIIRRGRCQVGDFYPALGLRSVERLLWNFPAPVLYWINFSLRF